MHIFLSISRLRFVVVVFFFFFFFFFVLFFFFYVVSFIARAPNPIPPT
jgi:hypothetical protein